MYGNTVVYKLKDRVLVAIQTLKNFVNKTDEFKQLEALIDRIDACLPQIKSSNTREDIEVALKEVQQCMEGVKAVITRMLKENFTNKTATKTDDPETLDTSVFRTNLVAMQEKIIMLETTELAKFIADVAKYKAKELEQRPAPKIKF